LNPKPVVLFLAQNPKIRKTFCGQLSVRKIIPIIRTPDLATPIS